MVNNSVKILKNYENISTEGINYRLLCLTGENKGTSYFLLEKRLLMGRDDSVDIQVLDIKSSRKHGELKKIGEDYYLTDLGSQNGILVNDLKIKQHKLQEGDKVIIGKTVFKYSKIINKPKLKIVDEVDNEAGDNKKANLKTVRLILLVVCSLSFAYLFISEEPKKGEKKKAIVEEVKTLNVMEEIIKNKNKKVDRELKKKLNTLLHRGQREYREGNYFRALEEFNLALILNPSDGQTNFYINRTRQRLDQYIRDLFLKARKEVESLKYKKALISYCSIISLLRNYKEDQRYKDAQKNITYVEEKLELGRNEYSCF